MKKVGFIGMYDKTDLILNIAKILTTMKKKVIVVDSTLTQKAKYVVPVINPTVTYITDFEDIDYKYIEMAHNVISKLTKQAINIKKEAEFMMYVPYNEIVDSEINDKVLVQGVVDLIIENKDSITIIDYKFSRLNVMILKEKYLEQLALYKKAVESAFNKKVDHVFIYSIMTGELF